MEKTIVKATVDLEAIGEKAERKKDRPEPEWERGPCPLCNEVCVSNAWYIGGRGYVIKISCWNALGESPTCNYERNL